MKGGRGKSKLASSLSSKHRKTLLVPSVEGALVGTVVSVLGMEQLSPSMGMDVSGLM